jgi:hypothetical protein
MSGSLARRTLFIWVSIVGATFFASWLGVSFIGGERAGLLEDDSYFYAQIAYNSFHLSCLTFDGLSPTSGFHPLWMAVLSGVAHVVGLVTQDKVIHLAAYLTAWFALVLLLADRTGATKAGRLAFVALALLTAPLMETALLALLFLLATERILRAPARKHPDVGLLALALLIPLTRIDAAPFALAWLLVLRGERGRVVAVGLGILLGIALHWAILQTLFGHPYTVSSLLKAGNLGQGMGLFRTISKSGILTRIAVLTLLVAWAWARNRSSGRIPTRTLILVGAPVLFTLTHVVLSDVRSWYFLPGFTLAFWLGERSLAIVAPETEWRAARTLVFGVLLTLTAYKGYRFIPLDHVRLESWNFVRDARSVLPDDARIFQVDGSGFTGYWLKRPVINGDGLVNTYDYARRLRARKLAGYLEERRVCYVITDAPLEARQENLVNLGGMSVKRSDAREILRSRAYGWSENRNAHFILWRIGGARCDRGVSTAITGAAS